MSTFTSFSNNQEIFFIILGAVLKYNLDNLIPVSYICNLPLTKFFSLISQNTGIPHFSIICLTFKAVFISHAITQTKLVISKKAEDKIQAKVKHCFRHIYKMVMSIIPKQRKFKVLVNIKNIQRNLDQVFVSFQIGLLYYFKTKDDYIIGTKSNSLIRIQIIEH